MLSLGLTLVSIALVIASRRTDPIDPLVRAAWGPILQRGSDVLVLISARPLLRAAPSQPGVKPTANPQEVAPE